MPRKIPEAQKQAAIQALAEGKTIRQTAKLTGISVTALMYKKNGLMTQAKQLKKELTESFNLDTSARIKKLADRLLEIAENCGVQLTTAKIKALPANLQALTAAIAIDKMQLLTGGATENVQMVAGNKANIIKKMNEISEQSRTAKNKPEAGKKKVNKPPSQ